MKRRESGKGGEVPSKYDTLLEELIESSNRHRNKADGNEKTLYNHKRDSPGSSDSAENSPSRSLSYTMDFLIDSRSRRKKGERQQVANIAQAFQYFLQTQPE